MFLAVLSATVIFLFIVLPFWLLYRRHLTPPAREAFGPATPADAAKAAPEIKPEPPDSDEDEKPIQFK